MDKSLFDVELYLVDLESRFNKINGSEYYLAYSGGRDSHFLYWFIKHYLKNNNIKIVSVNTRLEHPQILKRMRDNADFVLLPELKPHEVIEKVGMPCFTKDQDEKIRRFQSGSTAPSTLSYIYGWTNSTFNISKKARDLLLNGELHKVSSKCCDELKKKPQKKWAKQNNKKVIMGVRASESKRRKAQYKTCFSKKGDFRPIHDLTDELLNEIETKYNIEVPDIYNYTCSTGCMGCVYGKNIEHELSLLSKARVKYLWRIFGKSYKIKGVNFGYEE